MYNQNGILKIDKWFLEKYFNEDKKERIIKEIYISNRFYNKILLFLANSIEIFFLTFGLALSIQKDDIISLLYQIVIQVMLYFAIKQMGYYNQFQKKVTIYTMAFLLIFALFKYFRMNSFGKELTWQYYQEERLQKTAWGYVFNVDEATQSVTLNRFKSVSFELVCFLNTLCLFLYYNNQLKKERQGKPIGYIYHSMWLKMYMFPYYVFFALLAIDTFFAQNIIQFIVLSFLILICLLWATDNKHKNTVIKQAVFWSRRLYTFQLAVLALTQIPPIKEGMGEGSTFYNFLFITGLIVNPLPTYAAYIHIFVICYLLAFGQMYESTYENYQSYVALRQDYFKASIQDLKHGLLNEEGEEEDQNKMGKNLLKNTLQKTLKQQSENVNKAIMENEELIKQQEEEIKKQRENDKSYNILNYQKFVEHYAPYVYMWVLRITLIVLAYAYHTYKGFILLTWVLSSFIFPLISFVNISVQILLPLFLAEFLFVYLINIPLLFANSTFPQSGFYEIFGYQLQVPPLEIGIYFYTTIFFILLIPSRYILRLSRDEFRIDLFKKCSERKSNLLFQLLFYALKLIHIPALFLIFILGLKEYNIYYIGLMFFFVVFAASLKTYRKTGMLLILYSTFFIFIQYLWSLISPNFESDNGIAKLFNMLTFSNLSTSNTGLNCKIILSLIIIKIEYLSYNIPYDQWIVLFVFIFLTAINYMFREEEPKLRPDPDEPTQKKLYNSTAAYYEDKCDSVMRKKFPLIAKYLNRVMQIVSQFIIIFILIIQCAIVVLQPPSLFFWGFLIFSLTLQTVVIKTSEDRPETYQKCVSQSRILRYYSMIILVAQVSYFFITDQNFLAQYGFKDLLNMISGPLQNYFTVIGFKSSTNSTNLAVVFGSQIAFYIMAAYLEDYFIDENEKMKERRILEAESLDINTHGSIVMKTIGRKKTGPQVFSPNNRGKGEVAFSPGSLDEREEEEDLTDRIKYQFENIRYTIPYIIYKRQDLWRFVDSISMNFHLITATVTIIYCTNWQISLFMGFYLCSSIILCIRASKDLYKGGQIHFSKNQNKAVSIEEAHFLNKTYMERASSTLLKIRTNQWGFQYWILIASLIIMYPTPALQRLATNQWTQYQTQIYNYIFWLFWSGIFKSQEDITEISSHLPLYVMMIILIIEKQFQKWSRNRFGCTMERIQKFKQIDENMLLIEKGLSSEEIQYKLNQVARDDIQSQNKQRSKEFFYNNKNASISVSIGEARQECARIESLYREETVEMRKEQLRESLTLSLKRKYFYNFRSSLKIVLEQTSLFLLLISCTIKSNVISILYLGLLLFFLLTRNKTRGMLVMSYTFGIMIIIQYFLVLTNLISENSPYEFPSMFNPYPNDNYPIGYFWVPWIPQIKVFVENPTFTHFLGLDPEHANINDIWYDFANLVLLTIYFFNSGNPIDSQNIKVRFSLSRTCEKELNDYAKIMQKQKAIQKQGISLNMEEKSELEETDRINKKDNSYSEEAADNSREYLLGPTYYLNDLKSNIFYFYFTKKMRYFVYIGWQLFTIVAIFAFAFLCKSYLSLGYMITCIPLILFVTDFFYLEQVGQQGRKWLNPYLICGPLMIYSFLDISLQIIFGTFLHTSTFWKDTFGAENLWFIGDLTGMEKLLQNDTSLEVLESVHLKFSILKCFNLFFIFLQARIYQSEGFEKFVKNELKKLTNLAHGYKKMALTYRYNNAKIQQILTLQENKRRMFAGVAELKMKLHLWNELVQQGLTSQKMSHLKGNKDKSKNPFQFQDQDEEQKSENQQQQTSSLLQDTNQQTQKEPLLQQDKGTTLTDIQVTKKAAIMEKLKNLNKVSKIRELAEKDDDFFEKQHLMKKMIAKLPRFGRYYYNLKAKKINLIAFMTDVEDLKETKKNMEQGKRKITNELEEIMMRDINIYFARKQSLKLMQKTNSSYGIKKDKKEKKEKEELTFEKMPYTSEFLKSSSLIPALFGAYMEYYFSNCATIAYLFMIISQIVNAGFISLLYPFAVFGYALMEEQRPGKGFWRVMIYYTLFILFMKFIFQLDTWVLITDLQTNYSSINDWILLGLWRVEGIWSMFLYILPELVVLLAIMGQIYYEILIGLYEKKEIDLENIQQARERFLRSLQQKQNLDQTLRTIAYKQKDTAADEEQQPQTNLALDENGFTEEERIKDFLNEIKTLHITKQKKMYKEDDNIIKGSTGYQNLKKEFNEDLTPYEPRRKYSMIDDKIERYVESQRLNKERKSKKKQTFVKKYFAHKSYFQRLFPLVKEQKPGKDLYGQITFWQFVICVYLISYYTEMDAVGTQNLEASSQFSINMVAVLFLQIFVMTIERYISRTNTRVVVRKIGADEGQANKQNDDKLLQTMRVNSQVNFDTSMQVRQIGTNDNLILTPKSRKIAEDMKNEVPNIVLEQTKMTTQQVAKYLIQWFLLIFYHLLVFWYFPLRSNYAIYGTPTCNPDSNNYEKYGCLSFKSNITLIIFYIIFCYYFMLSAIQIRVGYPDFKRGSSFFDSQDRLHWIYYLLFYITPFLMELKTILDWTFTKTSLDLLQWLQLVQFQSEQYMAKVSGYFTFAHPLGKKIHHIEKCICSCFCLGLIMFFLIGPFFLFSDLSFIASYNLVTDTQASFNMRITNDNTSETYIFPLFEAATPLYIQDMSEAEFKFRNYDVIVDTKFFDYSQVQKIKIKNASETSWDISSTYKQDFQYLLSQAISKDPNITIELDFQYSFVRPGPATAPTTTGNEIRTLNQTNSSDNGVLQEFLRAISLDCTRNRSQSEQIFIPQFVQEEVRLTQDITVMPIQIKEKSGLNLTYSCENYWSLYSEDGNSVEFITFSDLIAASFISASSITAFYLAVSCVAGSALRGFIYKGERVFIVDSRNSQAILNLIDCIYLMRHLQNLKKEEELFFVLMDLLRSPEMLKVITGISLRDDEVNKPVKN